MTRIQSRQLQTISESRGSNETPRGKQRGIEFQNNLS